MSHLRRVEMIAAHLGGQETRAAGVAPQPTAAAGPKSPNDVVIIAAVRTPIARGKKGSFRDTCPEELLAAALKGVVARAKIDPALVEDIQVGNVLPAGGGATTARMAQLYAGFPNTSSIATVNRQCSSGLQAVANIAAAIQTGSIDIGIGAGVESMTKGYGAGAMASEFSSRVQSNKEADDCLLPMGITSENVATKYGVTRAKQDAFAVVSHQRAAEAQAKGLFDEEIIPVSIANPDDPDKELVVTKDEGIRGETTLQSLAKLKPAFKDDGSTTAGNASQVSDGAAAVLLMRRSVAEKLGFKPIGRFVSFAVAGVPPNIMGVGPAVAIPKVLQKAGLKKEDIAVYEINEAFASQAVYCVETLGLDPAKVNPKGGAIALGHPLGCTGARQIATILPELKRRNAKYGVTSMCIGSGMGAAAVIERE